jgi:putative oxidoreductase
MLKLLMSIRPIALDAGLFLVRVIFSLLLMQYGWEKFSKYSEWSVDFPDPLGVGSPLSLALAIFAELFCAGFLALGLFTRFALIPLIINMVVIALIVHADDPMREREHAISFLVPFLLIFMAGPGKYSLDNLFMKKN